MSDTSHKGSEQNKLEGKARQLGGRVKQALGDLTGDTSDKIEGRRDELKGRAQERLGDAQRDLEEIDRTDR